MPARPKRRRRWICRERGAAAGAQQRTARDVRPSGHTRGMEPPRSTERVTAQRDARTRSEGVAITPRECHAQSRSARAAARPAHSSPNSWHKFPGFGPKTPSHARRPATYRARRRRARCVGAWVYHAVPQQRPWHGEGHDTGTEGGSSPRAGIHVRAGLQLGTPSSCRGCMPTAAAQRERGIVCRWLRAFRVPRASRDSPDPRGSTKALEGAQDSQKGMPALFAPLVPPGLGASMVSTSDTFMAPVVLGGHGAAPHGGCVSKRCRRSL